jgi:cyclase
MLAKRIIPCLDVKEGRVVKGVKFVDHRDAGDPVEMASLYEKEEADELVFYDITASYEKREIMLKVVRAVSRTVFMPLMVGGGLRKIEDVRKILAAGADKVSLNTAAVKDPPLIEACARHFGSQCTVLGVDAKRREKGKWEVYIEGGHRPTGIDVLEWIKKAEDLGAGEVVLNSIDCDGTKSGYDIELTRKVSEMVNIPLIASGGAGKLEHLYQALARGKADAALAASIFHYGEYSIREAKQYLQEKGVPVRM